MTTIRVLVCDDHLIVREGIKQMLADSADIAVAAEAESGPQALRIVRELHAADGAAADAATGKLDVVLMDIAMPHRDGLDVLKQLKGEFPKLPVLMLSTYPDRQYAVRSLKLGAVGYLNKSADSEQMAAAIRKAAAGGLFITPSVAEQLASQIGAGRKGANGEAAPHEQLSHREYQVFRLLASGRSVGEIAEQLAHRLGTPSAHIGRASWTRPARATTWRWRSTRCGRSCCRCSGRRSIGVAVGIAVGVRSV